MAKWRTEIKLNAVHVVGLGLVDLTVVLLGGALLVPWVCRAMPSAAVHVPVLRPLAAQPFHRDVNRCLLGLARVGLWPLLRRHDFVSWRERGWSGESQSGGLALLYLATTLASAAGSSVLWGSRRLTEGWGVLPAFGLTAGWRPWMLRRPTRAAQP